MRESEEEIHKQFYQRALRNYGVEDVRALHWNSQRTQEVRFEQLLKAGSLEGKSILDLGCGTGDLRGFLNRKRIYPALYTGIDFVDEFVMTARRRYPSDRWACGDFFTFPYRDVFDIILCNGALNVRKKDNMKFLKQFLVHFIPLAKETVAFTLLKYARGYMNDPMIYTYDVKAVSALLQSFAVPFHIVEGYIDNDFSCFIRTGRVR